MAKENQCHVAIILCDMTRAFDLCNHNVLEKKLEHIGIRGPSLKLMLDFLRQRHQCVAINNGRTKSDSGNIDIGVPQGSSLANLCFLIQVNDLPKIVNGEMYIFADDACDIINANTIPSLENIIASEICRLQGWFTANGLVLNLHKTQVMHICLGGRPPRPLSVNVDGAVLPQVNSTKFLGVTLDAALKWNVHIDVVCGKLSGACFALSRLARILPHQQLRTSYFSLFHSVMCYGLEFWGTAAEWQRVFILQKRAVRIISYAPHGTPARQLFINTNIMTLTSQYLFYIIKYIRKNIHLFPIKTFKSSRITQKHKNMLDSTCCRLAKSNKTVSIAGPGIYNKLPDNIKNIENDLTFHSQLKKWLTRNAFYDIPCASLTPIHTYTNKYE
ncbi:uncharacterized protein LOC134647466 [Cydia amplana]|uniref:uncharacterized protein LOC134647466 n=1 Tax=Cydia amplana TaxID=1869771 RepID=UPI002FE58E82